MQQRRASDGAHASSVALALRAVDTMPHTCLLVVDPELRFQGVAGSALARFGYTAESMRGRSPTEVFPPGLGFRVTTRFSAALSGRESWDDTAWGGGEGTQETTYSPVRLEDGTIVAAVALVRETSAESRAVEALVASAHVHREVSAYTGDVLATFDARGCFSWVSESVTRATGWAPGELLGRRAYDLLHPDDAAQTRRRLGAVYQGADETTVRYRYRHRDGSYVWFEARVRPLPGVRGGVRGVVSTARSITVPRARGDELSRGSDTLETAFALAPTGMGLLAPDGTWLKANAAICAIFGRQEQELTTRTIQDLIGTDEGDSEKALMEDVLQGRRNSYQLESRFVRPDGSPAHVMMKVTLARTSTGSPRFFVVQAEDVTERRIAQDELIRRASSDPLTGLPNRTVLFDRLRHALSAAARRHVDVAVVFVDLDGFKQVNDSRGHAVGDEVLRQVAHRLRDAVREEDTVARFGGDEFVVLVEAVTEPTQVDVLVERLNASIVEPFDVSDGSVRVGLTVGVAVGSGIPAEDLLRRADAAMYAEKPRRVIDVR